MERNNAISILRVLSMLSIVSCHMLSFLNMDSLAMFFNVGVFVFLFISGFLYGNKNIDEYGKWFNKCCQKLLIPFYIFLFFLLTYYYLTQTGHFDLKTLFIFTFCLQGVHWLVPIMNVRIQGADHLWFITIIFLCYFLMLIVKKLESKYTSFDKHIVVIVLLILVFLQLAKFIGFKFNSEYFLIFFVGYFIAKYKVRVTKMNFVLLGLVAMVVSIVIRLLSKYLFDNMPIYGMIVPVTHSLLAVSFYFIISYLSNRFSKICSVISHSKLWMWFDNLSYYIYIIHYMFLVGPFSVDVFGFNKFVLVIIFALFVLLSSLVLYFVCYFINNKLPKIFKPRIQQY